MVMRCFGGIFNATERAGIIATAAGRCWRVGRRDPHEVRRKQVDDCVRSVLRALIAMANPHAAVSGKCARGGATSPEGHIPSNSAIVASSTPSDTPP
ncbi:MAG: hypothetical protein D6760_12315 [Deltaproteobacteria bacterium]|nr:MAG: hypothetical protein D6760_12315 [Deltaproteobacteria bacterium]